MKKWQKAYGAKIWLLLASGLAIITGLFATSLADTIVRAFDSKETLQPGWVVAIEKKSSNSVELAPSSDLSRIYGVVIDPSRAPATLQSQEGLKVFVATSGNYPVLVSTQNGTINPGDYISMSSTDGIAAKATTDQGYILGRAVEGFDGQKNVITAGEDGVAIGRIDTSITPGRNPLAKNAAAIPEPLRRVGEAIAGKNITPLRIYAALAIFTATSIMAASILWVGIRSGMISIGRNPLSRHSIVQGLIQIVIVALLVFACGIFAVYLLLRL